MTGGGAVASNKFSVSVKDKFGNFTPNFRVCIVAQGGQNNWPFPWKNVPIDRPLIVEPDPAKSGDWLYVEGPGNLRQPEIINWRTYFRIDRDVPVDYTLIIEDCDEIACAPCSAAPSASSDKVDVSERTSNDENDTNPAASHKYDCVEITVRAVDSHGNPVSGYLGRLKHHEPGPVLTENFDIGTEKKLHIRKARHAVWVNVWKAGTSTANGKAKRISPTVPVTVDVEVDEKAITSAWMKMPREVTFQWLTLSKKIPPEFQTYLAHTHEIAAKHSAIAYLLKNTALQIAIRDAPKTHANATNIRVERYLDSRQGIYFAIRKHPGISTDCGAAHWPLGQPGPGDWVPEPLLVYADQFEVFWDP